jgi:hypothetical protein
MRGLCFWKYHSLLLITALISVTTPALAQPIPTLRPPHGEINPTFWEQYGWLTIIVPIVLIIVIGALIVLLTRPKKNIVERPEIVARRGLAALRGRVTDGAMLMEVSRILRRYVVFAFDLPPQELTTTELKQTLQSLPRTEPALVAAVTEFLRQCDEDKFSPPALPPHTDAPSRALELLEKIEARRRLLLAQQPAA